MITQELLKTNIHYNPDTGVFTRIIKSGGNVGEINTKENDSGYFRVNISGKSYRTHRLAWLYMTGEWPKEHIDHINGMRNDNKFSNLRCASNAENMHNIGKYVTNTSGFKGVSWHKAAKKWCAQIKIDGKRIYLGLFESADLASKAYRDFAKNVHGEFYNGAN